MEIILQILLGIVALICWAGGMNILLKGAMAFLPKEVSPQLVLDDLVRFLAGIYFGAGFLFSYAVFHVQTMGNVNYFLGIMVAFSGLGRFYSRLKLGSAGRYFDVIMCVEIILGIAIMLLTSVSQI